MAFARRGLAIRQATRDENSPLGIRNDSPRTRLASNFAKATLVDTNAKASIVDAKKPDIKPKKPDIQLQRNPVLRPSARVQLTRDVSKIVADAAIAAKGGAGALPRIGSARPVRELPSLPASARQGTSRTRRQSAPDVLERLLAPRPGSDLHPAPLPVGEIAQRREKLESYRAAPLTIDNPNEEIAPGRNNNPWDAVFAGPGVSPGTKRSRRSSRDLTATEMMASYSRHGLLDGAAAAARPKVAKEDMGQTGGDALFAVVKAKMAARKRAEEHEKAEEVQQKSLAAASRAVMRKRALRESDLLIFRNIVAQLRKAHANCAEAVAVEPRLWNDWADEIRDHVDGLIESVSQQRQLLFGDEGSSGDAAAVGGAPREPSPAKRPHSSPAKRRAPAAAPRFTVLPAERDAEAGLLLEGVLRAVEGVVAAYERGVAVLDDAAWRRARAFGSLEQAEAKGVAFDKWVREKRSRLRELDLRFSEQQLEKTRLPERPIWADVDVDARRKKARERREGRNDPTPPPGIKGPSGPISRVDRY